MESGVVKLNILDLIVFLAYAFLFLKLFKNKSNKFTSDVLKKYFISFYYVKVVSCLLLTLFIVYLSPSDGSGIFFPEAKNINEQILSDPKKISFYFSAWQDNAGISLLDNLSSGYFKIASNLLVIKLTSFFSFFSFGSFLATSFLFSLIAFVGMWRLFLFFYHINPNEHKIAALCFLFLPTTVFWTSGIVKEAVSFGCLGFLTYALYNLYVKRKYIILNVGIVIIASILLFTVKGYTIIAYLPLLVLFLVRHNSVAKIQNKLLRFLYIAVFLVIIGFAAYFYIDANGDIFKNFALDAVTEQISNQSEEFKRQADDATSSFNLGVDFDPSPAGIVRAIPFAITAALYRPFLWEAKKITTLLSALESLAFLLITLFVFFKCGPIFTIKKLTNDRLIFFCFWFSIVFAFFCGISTLNFGSLVRYKLPCLPFYLYALLLVYMHKKAALAAKQQKNAVVLATRPLPLSS
jgi:hypothetical protein